MSNKIAYVTPLVWCGSKLHIADKIKPFWEASGCQRMVEPFAGCLAISFSLSCNKVLANDMNQYLINFFREIQENPELDIHIDKNEGLYYEYRKEFNENVRNYTSIFSAPKSARRRQAELFYVLNRYCFNGLYRVNSKGEFNVSFADFKYTRALQDLTQFFDKTKEWEFYSGDFSALKIEKDDFLFVDPPYDQTFTSYTKEQFSFEDQVRLVKWLDEIAPKNPTIITNQNTDRMKELYTEHGYTLLESRRTKNFKGKATLESKKEVMAVRNVRI